MASPGVPIYTTRKRSIFGPVMLIGTGVVFLLITAGILTPRTAAVTFAKWWPLLLIFWGAVKLFEYQQAKNAGLPAPGIGAGGVIIVIFLLIVGSISSAAYKASGNVNWDRLRGEMNIDDEDVGLFAGQRFDYVENIEQDLPAGGSLRIVSDRGDVKITASADNKVHIIVRKAIYAENSQEAEAASKVIKPTITMEGGNRLSIDATRRGDWKPAAMNLEIQMPRKAQVDVMTKRGDIELRGREGMAKLHTGKGGIVIQDLIGSAETHMRSGDFTARNVTGDVSLEGRVTDTTVSDIAGKLSLQGEFFGHMLISRVGKGVAFKSNRTDLEFTKLEGDLRLGDGDLKANLLTGPFRLITKSKDIRLDDITGDVRVENTNGEVEVQPKGNVGSVQIRNSKGVIRLILPAAANVAIDARADRGEIESDFTLTTTNEHREARATGVINKGGASVVLNNERGTIFIRKQ